MVKKLVEHLSNGAGETLAKGAPTFFILAAMAIAMQWMHNASTIEITRSHNTALEKATDRLIESNATATASMRAQQDIMFSNQTKIIDNQSRIINNTEANTRAIIEVKDVMKEQLEVAKETLTIIKTKGP